MLHLITLYHIYSKYYQSETNKPHKAQQQRNFHVWLRWNLTQTSYDRRVAGFVFTFGPAHVDFTFFNLCLRCALQFQLLSVVLNIIMFEDCKNQVISITQTVCILCSPLLTPRSISLVVNVKTSSWSDFIKWKGMARIWMITITWLLSYYLIAI